MINLSIVIPCFNEAKSLPKLVKDFSKKLKRKDVELILVNNGSNDSTETIISNLKKDYNFLKMIKLKKNNGYGNGILQGLKKAKGKYISWTHADLQTDPYDVIIGFEKFEKELSPKIFIKGNRLGRPLKDIIFTIGMSIFETILLKKFFWDVNAQPNIFHKNFFNMLEKIPLDFSFDLFFYFNAKKKKLKILRFPVKYPERKFGVSHWNTDFKNKMKFIKRTIKYSFQLKKEL
ncbi:MAG: glycosyltransferase family 2 protein [Alphaproteobacteria bacterium]|nr:glycosyltransferase family 2 protein [Alphaproteobacteria bacterium]|tara:strand:- start:76 stop:774 length:699 start_codon:yes stop_codon:yes gene_type:complete